MGFNKVEIESICIRQISGIVHKGGRRHSEHYLRLVYTLTVDYPYLHSIVSTFIFVTITQQIMYNCTVKYISGKMSLRAS